MNPSRPKSSLAESLANHYRAAIAGRQFKPGEVLPSENSLAKEFGLSRVTVRKGLELLHQERLIQPIRGYGWVFGAGAAPSGGSGITCAGFLYSSELDGHQSVEAIFEGFKQEAGKSRILFEKLMLPRFSDKPFSEQPVSQRLLRGELCGIAIHGAFPREYLLWLLQQQIPVVQIGSILGSGLPIPQVSYDLVQIYYESVGLLLREGLRRIKVPMVKTSEHNEALIYGGVLSALKAGGAKVELEVFESVESYGAEEGRRLARQWIATGEAPDGVVAADEEMGIAMAEEFTKRGHQSRVILIGNFRKQIGFDAVELDAKTLGSEACKLLCQRLNESTGRPLLHYIPITLVRNKRRRSR